MSYVETVSHPMIREAKAGDESGMHEAHMRSIREVCIRDHGEQEVSGWGNRPLGDRWMTPIREGGAWVVEFQGRIAGVGYVQVSNTETDRKAHIFGLYLTPEIIGQGFGAKLLQLMLDRAKSAGVKAVTLDSTLTAHEFYKRFGFCDSGPMKWTDIGGSQVRGYPMTLILHGLDPANPS